MADSKSVQIAEDVAELLNQTTWEWPSAWVPTTPDVLGAVVPSTAYVLPLMPRMTGDPQISVSPVSNMNEDESYSDSCGRRWNYEIDVALHQRLDERDSNFKQPATLAAIDKMILLSEAVRDFFDANRVLGAQSNGIVAQIDSMQQSLYSESELKDNSFYLMSLRLNYLS